MANKDVTKGMIEPERYKRQELIWGKEGQSKLSNARVSVVGMDHLGVYTALCLASLGVGHIRLMDAGQTKKSQNFIGEPLHKATKVEEYARVIGKVNPQVSFELSDTDLDNRIDQIILADSDVIIDTTNSPRSKSLAINYGREIKVPVLSASAIWGYTKLMYCDPSKDDVAFLMPLFEGMEQSELMALIMCGVIAEEARKLVFGEKENYLEYPVRYQLGKGYRFGYPMTGDVIASLPDKSIFSNASVAFFGGGALASWGAPGVASLGFKAADIYDYDKYESHNINRQVLGYDGIGKAKATHIAEKITAMSHGKTKSAGFNVLITPEFDAGQEYDIIFDFVDNIYTRAINAAYSITHNVPMISAGVLPYSARSITQMKGKTSCMGCVYDIFERGKKEEMIRRASCVNNPNPSVVMSNAIGAGLAIAESLSVLQPEVFGEPFNGELSYRADGMRRFGTNPIKKVCDCYSKPVPHLKISDEDVNNFLKDNPGALLRQR